MPPKQIEEYTFEELMIEYFEDFYFDNPEKADEFLDRRIDEQEEFVVPAEVRKMIARRKDKVDLSKYRTEGDENLSDQECKKILDSIRGVKDFKIPKDINDDFTR